MLDNQLQHESLLLGKWCLDIVPNWQMMSMTVAVDSRMAVGLVVDVQQQFLSQPTTVPK